MRAPPRDLPRGVCGLGRPAGILIHWRADLTLAGNPWDGSPGVMTRGYPGSSTVGER
jgi:hypothetical protein